MDCLAKNIIITKLDGLMTLKDWYARKRLKSFARLSFEVMWRFEPWGGYQNSPLFRGGCPAIELELILIKFVFYGKCYVHINKGVFIVVKIKCVVQHLIYILLKYTQYFIKTHTNIKIFDTFGETVPQRDLRISRVCEVSQSKSIISSKCSAFLSTCTSYGIKD